jgi:hypothetical protein
MLEYAVSFSPGCFPPSAIRKTLFSHKKAQKAQKENPNYHTLQPLWFMRLIDQKSVNWQNRAQFFGIAAQMMLNRPLVPLHQPGLLILAVTSSS